jgi:hypothetical protein
MAVAELRAVLLTASTPATVKGKIDALGRLDYISIFCRAIGLNTVFTHPPASGDLSEEFLRNYHRFADSLYECYLSLEQHPSLDPRRFRFCVYASGGYSRMLEWQWEEDAE